jgi:hypothetical protein
LRCKVLDQAFSKDDTMIKAANDTFATFMDSTLKFGAICTEAKKEEWRLARIWPRMLADGINTIISSPVASSRDELIDLLSIVVLLKEKTSFVNFHKRHLAKRLLNPVKGDFGTMCVDLEKLVVSRLETAWIQSLVSDCNHLLRDNDECMKFSRELLESQELRQHKELLGPVNDFDMRYFSKKVWKDCGVW